MKDKSFKVRKENRTLMYKNENGPRFTAYLNIEGIQYRAVYYAEVGNDDVIYYSGPVTRNDETDETEQPEGGQ